ncbi:MAG: DUF1801 domain-containing protein [Planctomycetes bacterium]|nr:DUF1801 domain-containing protein [Planctomycetota bacterium]
MVQSRAVTVAEYLAGLPEDRRTAIEAVRAVILKNLPRGFEERMSYGMIGYVVPHSLYPPGYHCDPQLPLPFACLASQKNHMAVYLMSIYGDKTTEDWFIKEYKATGKKLDMGKSCIRFKKLDDLPLELIGKVIARVPVKKWIEVYEQMREQTAAGSRKPRASQKSKKTKARVKR